MIYFGCNHVTILIAHERCPLRGRTTMHVLAHPARLELKTIAFDKLFKHVDAEKVDPARRELIHVFALEKMKFAGQHAGERDTDRPHVDGVRIVARTKRHLGRLPVQRHRLPAVVRTIVVEERQAKVAELQIARVKVVENVDRFDVHVHDAARMSAVQRDEHASRVLAHVLCRQQRECVAIVGVVGVREHEPGVRATDAHHVEQLQRVRNAFQSLQHQHLCTITRTISSINSTLIAVEQQTSLGKSDAL